MAHHADNSNLLLCPSVTVADLTQLKNTAMMTNDHLQAHISAIRVTVQV